jgi:hypothetical protein
MSRRENTPGRPILCVFAKGGIPAPLARSVITKVRRNARAQDCAVFASPRRYARIMSSQTSSQTIPRPRKRKKSASPRRNAGGAGWVAWWPLLAGIAITFAAVKTAEILPLMGADGLLKLRRLYPYALLLKQPQLGLSEQTSDNWSQIMLYAQWLLYGLYATVAMKWKPVWKVLMQVAVIHLLGFSLLWLLARN